MTFVAAAVTGAPIESGGLIGARDRLPRTPGPGPEGIGSDARDNPGPTPSSNAAASSQGDPEAGRDDVTPGQRCNRNEALVSIHGPALDKSRSTPFFESNLSKSAQFPHRDCRRGVGERALNPVSELDPASPQSLGKVKDDIAQSPPLCPICGDWRPSNSPPAHCGWFDDCPMGELPDVSAYESAAVHRENTSDGAELCAAQEICPPRDLC